MNKSNEIVSSKPGTSKLSRAKFGPGMLLKHEDLELLNSYTRDLSRLMFRSLFGCGVVCGLVVDTKTECGKVVVTVGSGVAITCSGDPIWVPREESLPAHDECDDGKDDELWIVLCRTVKCCAPRPATCSSGDDEMPSVCTRELFGYELQVRNRRPECVCDCIKKPTSPVNGKQKEQTTALETDDETNPCLCADPTLPCYASHYDGKCGCSCSECADCDCDCVLLARLHRNDATNKWDRDHSVRRFVRPVLIRDPQPELDKEDEDKSGEGEDEVDVAYAATRGDELLVALTAKKSRASGKSATTKKGKKTVGPKPGLPK
jgi:hypothetical protein